MSSTSPVLKSRRWKPRASETTAPLPSLRSAIEPIFCGTSQERISRAGRRGAEHAPIEAVDPIEAFLLDVPKRSFAERGLDVDNDFDAHDLPRRSVASLEGDLVAAFELRISRASSGVATDMPSPSMIWRASITCSAFDFASLPGPAHRLSSSPTRILPTHGGGQRGDRAIGCAPAPSTDQR